MEETRDFFFYMNESDQPQLGLAKAFASCLLCFAFCFITGASQFFWRAFSFVCAGCLCLAMAPSKITQIAMRGRGPSEVASDDTTGVQNSNRNFLTDISPF